MGKLFCQGLGGLGLSGTQICLSEVLAEFRQHFCGNCGFVTRWLLRNLNGLAQSFDGLGIFPSAQVDESQSIEHGGISRSKLVREKSE